MDVPGLWALFKNKLQQLKERCRKWLMTQRGPVRAGWRSTNYVNSFDDSYESIHHDSAGVPLGALFANGAGAESYAAEPDDDCSRRPSAQFDVEAPSESYSCSDSSDSDSGGDSGD